MEPKKKLNKKKKKKKEELVTRYRLGFLGEKYQEKRHKPNKVFLGDYIGQYIDYEQDNDIW